MDQDHRTRTPLRRRPPLACIECRRRKVRCSRTLPCARCQKARSGRPCIYESRDLDDNASPPRASDSRSISSTSSVERDDVLVQLAQSSPCGRSSLQQNTATVPPAPANHLPPPEGPRSDAGFQSQVTPKATLTYLRYHTEHFQEPLEGRDVSLLTSVARGHDDRMRYWGRTHYATEFLGTEELRAFVTDFQIPQARGRFHTGSRISNRNNNPRQARELHQFEAMRQQFPPRNVTDVLVRLYLDNFEATYRILHIPSFLHDYELLWTDRHGVSGTFIAAVLCIISVGQIFHPHMLPDGTHSVDMVGKWTSLVEMWLEAREKKYRLSVSILQVQCLLVLFHQVNSAEGTLRLVAAGALLRSAFAAGLHRDPPAQTGCPPLVTEMRRRLWYTIVDLDLQSSLELGMPSMLHSDSFDTSLPSNVEDEQLSPSLQALPEPLPPSQVTRTSLQILYARSLGTRLHIARLVNKANLDVQYQDVLRIDARIRKTLDEVFQDIDNCRRLDANPSPIIRPDSFPFLYFQTLCRRWLAFLHQPFALRASHDPRYLYSQRVCVDIAEALHLSLPKFSPLSPTPIAGPLLVPDIFHAILALCRQVLLETSISAPGRHSSHHAASPTVTSLMTQAGQLAMFLTDASRRSRAMASADLWLSMALGLARARADGGAAADGAAGIRAGLRARLQSYLPARGRGDASPLQRLRETEIGEAGTGSPRSDAPGEHMHLHHNLVTSQLGASEVGQSFTSSRGSAFDFASTGVASIGDGEQALEGGELEGLLRIMTEFEEGSFSPWFDLDGLQMS